MTNPVTTAVDDLPVRQPRFALSVIQFGAIAAVLAASASRGFELDRFLVPKELVLHATALLAGLFSLRALRRVGATSVDRFLLLYLLLGAISAALATNRWLGLRALAVSASAIALFWIGRALRECALARPLLGALAAAVVLAAITALLQAYGVELDVFAQSRAPGGTLGNRNSIGHMAAFGLPVVLLAAMRASTASRQLLASTGVAIVSAALVLTRSRAAWIAAAAVVFVFLAALIIAAPLRRDGRTWARLLTIVLFAAGGVVAALLIPNELRWRSDNPYLESMKGVAAYEEGSGRGRLIQYQRSMVMAAHHPLFGAGPGNWPVDYPAHAARSDPSMNESEPGMTYNPWPSSDWVAFISERGFAAALLLLLIFFALALSALRRLTSAIDVDDALLSTTLLSTLAGAGLAGAFDAVLLLGAPTLLVWVTLGATWAPAPAQRPIRASFAVLVIVIAAVGLVRSASQLFAMEVYASGGQRSSLERASVIDPGNYRLHSRLARGGRTRCQHARAAHELFPHAAAPRPCRD